MILMKMKMVNKPKDQIMVKIKRSKKKQILKMPIPKQEDPISVHLKVKLLKLIILKMKEVNRDKLAGLNKSVKLILAKILLKSTHKKLQKSNPRKVK